MLLRQTQRSSLPVAYLFDLANLLAEHAKCHLGETRLLLHEAHFTEVGLSIDEPLYVLHELEMRMLPGELLDIRRETETNDN